MWAHGGAGLTCGCRGLRYRNGVAALPGGLPPSVSSPPSSLPSSVHILLSFLLLLGYPCVWCETVIELFLAAV